MSNKTITFDSGRRNELGRQMNPLTNQKIWLIEVSMNPFNPENVLLKSTIKFLQGRQMKSV